MTKSETIRAIASELATLDETRLQAVADIVRSMTAHSHLPRDLTRRELDLIEQSKQDFQAGRSFTLAEARAMTDQFLAGHGVAPSRT